MTTPTPPAEAFNKYIGVVADCIQTNMETSSALASSSNTTNDGLVSLTQSWTTDSGNHPIAFLPAPPVSPYNLNPQPIPIYGNPIAAALYGGYYFPGPGSYAPGDTLITPSPTNTQYPGLGLNPSTNIPQGFVANPYINANTQFIPNNNNYGTGATNYFSPAGSPSSTSNTSIGQSVIIAFIGTYFGGSTYNINELSTSEVLSVITALQNNWDVPPTSGTDQSSVALGTANATNTLVSSAGTDDEQSLQTLCSTLTNMLGQSQNALQTIVSGGSSVLQTVSSLINSMAYY